MNARSLRVRWLTPGVIVAAAALACAPDAMAAAAVAAGDSTGGIAVAEPADAETLAAVAPPARLPSSAVHAWQTGLLRADRLEHASLSFTLASCAGLAGRKRPEAFTIAFALGFAKELHDGRSGRFDPVDLAADLVGASLGAFAAARR